MARERDQSLHENIELETKNSKLKIDIKKFEDIKASWGWKLKRDEDSVAALKIEVDKLKESVARAEAEVEKEEKSTKYWWRMLMKSWQRKQSRFW